MLDKLQLKGHWFVIAIFALIFMPKWGYFPQAITFLSILLFVYSISSFKVWKTTIAINYCDIGFGLLLIAVLISFTKAFFANGFIPSEYKHAIFLLYITSYFSFRVANLQTKALANVSIVANILLGFFLIYVAYQGLKVNYAQLTINLSYERGIGNISQVAMYSSFYLVLILLSKNKSPYFHYIAIVAAAVLAFILKSKLLFLVIGLALLSILLNKQTSSKKIAVIALLSLVSFVYLTFFTPSSFEGRLSNFMISINNLSFGEIIGVGLGNFDTFINQIFFSGSSINDVGVINHIAFNDYMQSFIELGILGLGGLAFISFSILRGQHIFLACAIILVALIMFPLQYIESGILWVVCVFFLSDKTSIIKEELSLTKRSKGFILASSIAALAFTLYLVSIHKSWSDIDRAISKNKSATTVSKYQKLYPYFKDDAEFHYNYARQLQQISNRKEALKELEYSVQLNKSYDPIIHLADSYYDAKKMDKAIYYYEAASRLRPDNLFPIYKLIFSYYKLGNTTKMKSLYDQVGKFKDSHNIQVQSMLKDLEKLFAK